MRTGHLLNGMGEPRVPGQDFSETYGPGASPAEQWAAEQWASGNGPAPLPTAAKIADNTPLILGAVAVAALLLMKG